MSRSSCLSLPLSLLVSLLSLFGLFSLLWQRTAHGCKPCGEPTLAALLAKADVVAVAKVVKVKVEQRAPAQESGERNRDVSWFVSVERPIKGSPRPVLTVKHADNPPCISARVPEPGRYLMLLYFREDKYTPLNYCDQPLFAIDAQDQVTLTPEMAKELKAASERVPLQRVVEWVSKRVAQQQQPAR